MDATLTQSSPLDALPAFERDLRRKPAGALTAEGYLRDVRQCLLSLSVDLDRPAELRDLTLDRLQDWADTLPGGPAKRQRSVYAMKRFLRFLAKRKYISPADDVSDYLEAPAVVQRPPKFFSIEECERLMKAPLQETREGRYWEFALRDTAILWFLWEGGLRVSELCGLDLDRIRLDLPHPGDVSVEVLGKGGKWRWVQCKKDTRAALDAYLAVRGQFLPAGPLPKAVFVSQQRTRLCRYSVGVLVKRHAAQVGLVAWPHLLRHCCATHMLWKGAELSAVQKHLGHSKITTTQIYAHVDLVHQHDKATMFHPANCRPVPPPPPAAPAPPPKLGIAQAAKALVGAVGRFLVGLVEPAGTLVPSPG